MHLEEHLKETGQSQSAFGARLVPPASQGLVSQWVRGITRITLSYALEIERESGSAVTPQDCSDMFIDPANRQPAQSAPAQ
jgi:DNA-binding transcriptional regulator YdaS (Cro superfamily)